MKAKLDAVQMALEQAQEDAKSMVHRRQVIAMLWTCGLHLSLFQAVSFWY